MITYLILGITVVVSFICFGNQTLAMKLALSPYQVIHRQEWYRVVTHGFVHADMTHLLVNMFTFWSFGTYMEQYYQYVGLGKWGFLLLYFEGMIFASSFDLAKQKDNPYYLSIGASGAVSAVLFSSIFFDPWGKIYFFALLPIPGILFGVIYLLYCQYMAKQASDHINHNAHFLGALFGFLLPALLNPSLVKLFLGALIGR